MDLSVLLPLSQSPERAHACLESLESTLPKRCRYEGVEVADAAQGTSRALLDTLGTRPRYQVLRHDAPRGRAACLNAAAKAAHGPLYCLLDPGTTLMPGWLEPMRRLMEREPAAGCVGNVHREPYSGLIDHAGITFDADGLPVAAGRNEAFQPRDFFNRRAAVSAACCLVHEAAFHRVGGFDERFQTRFDDVDFCLRTAEVGYRHFVANRSVVYHHAGPVPTGDGNLELYRARWGDRARAYAVQKGKRRDEAGFSPERWEMGRESRRQERQDVRDAAWDGRRYLRKHLHQPWRYNYGRVCRALAKAVRPAPAAIPPPPACLSDDAAVPAGAFAPGGDAVLFDPPRR